MEEAKGKETESMSKYLAENKITAKPTASGLIYAEKKKGTGKQAEKGKTVKVNYTGSIGSFSSTNHVVKIDAGIKNFLSSTRFLYEQSKNDFPFTDFYNQPQKQQHANLDNIGVLQNFYYSLIIQRWFHQEYGTR